MEPRTVVRGNVKRRPIRRMLAGPSMGPRTLVRGNKDLDDLAGTFDIMLQWRHGPSSAETECLSSAGFPRVLLQWGRGRLSAESAMLWFQHDKVKMLH
jgi:hypothetical protein